MYNIDQSCRYYQTFVLYKVRWYQPALRKLPDLCTLYSLTELQTLCNNYQTCGLYKVLLSLCNIDQSTLILAMKLDGQIWRCDHYMIIFGLGIRAKHGQVGQAKPGFLHFGDDIEPRRLSSSTLRRRPDPISAQLQHYSSRLWVLPRRGKRFLLIKWCFCRECVRTTASTWMRTVP